MTSVLQISASPRASVSVSRQVSDDFVSAWMREHPAYTLTSRDLNDPAMPYVTEEVISAFYTPPMQRTTSQIHLLAFSDELVAELMAADTYVFAMPMYNFSVPAIFKAYIDLVVRIGVTVTPTWEGLLKNRKAYLITARGGAGYGKGEPREAYNFEDPYLRTVLELLGVTDQTYIHVAATSDPEAGARSLATARQRVRELVGA